jgi:hypothetical protein
MKCVVMAVDRLPNIIVKKLEIGDVKNNLTVVQK